MGGFWLHKDELLMLASCARDMRRVSFLGARVGRCYAGMQPAPRKIPRDSPAALPRAQKKLMRCAVRLVFWTVSFSTDFISLHLIVFPSVPIDPRYLDVPAKITLD